MIKLWQKWAVMIDVNNVCRHNCIYCTKHIRHLRKDQIVQMTEDEIIKAIKSLEGWPGKIGFTGGEPLNYPDVPGLCRIVKDMIPKERALIFTSHEKKLIQYKNLIDDTFGEVYINLHTEEQKKVCLHHPLLLAVGDMAPNEEVMEILIENCWCNKMWSPIIGKKGAFFCDCALGFDTALDMDGGWPVEPGWWKRDDYTDQIKKYCHLCGMCLPYPGQKLEDGEELISYGLYEKFKKHRLRNLENMRVIKDRLTRDEIERNLIGWNPWHNRQDRGYEGPEYVNIKIAIVSAWYNEELLAPLFLKHYDYVDEIHIILDTATNDRTEEILKSDKRVIIHRQAYPPDGLDWTIKQAKVDEIYASIDADWVFAVDADEFLFKKGEKDIKRFLAMQTGEIMWAKLWQVYRHETDADIDYTKPPVPQRRHGIPLEPETIDYHFPDRTYLKPIVVRGGRKPQWDCGCHVYYGKLTECREVMDGAHWHMADPEIAIKRRLQTKARQSIRNLKLGYGIQNHFVTRDSILYECWLHRFDPVVIYTGFEDDEHYAVPGATPLERWRNTLCLGLEDKLQKIDWLFENYKNDNEKFVTEVYRLFPEHALYLNRVSEHLLNEGKYDSALKLLLEGLKYNPDYGDLWCNLGAIHYFLGKYEEAEKYLKRAVEIDNTNETYRENLEIVVRKAKAEAKEGDLKEYTDEFLPIKDRSEKDQKKEHITVLMLFKDNIDYVRKQLSVFFNNTKSNKLNVIALNIDGSERDVDDVDKSFNSRILYVNVDSHERIARVLNAFIEKAKGEYIVIITGGIVPAEGWLEAIFETLNEESETKIITPKIVDKDNFIVEAGFSEIRGNSVKPNGFGEEMNTPAYNKPIRLSSGSQFCIFVEKKLFIDSGMFDEQIDDLKILMIDAVNAMLSRGVKALYQPKCLFRLDRNSTGKFKIFENNIVTEEALKLLRPVILIRNDLNENGNIKKFKILVLGVYLADKPNNIDDIVKRICECRYCNVTQKWVSIAGNAPTERVDDVTVKYLKEPRAKYEILNELLVQENINQYDYIVISDDDIVLPFDFLDNFIILQEKLGFVIAQPSRTSNSFIDHPIVEQQRGVIARQTLFVEIGPLVSVNKSIYDVIFPFDLTSPMGWGYENHWAYEIKKRGLKMGIIDNTPVDHSIRKPVENYSWHEADEQRRLYWGKYPNLTYEECFKVIKVYTLRGSTPWE